MWGSIGFGIFGISAGYLVDVFSKGQYNKDYACIFYIMLIAMILDIIVSATLRKVRRISKCASSLLVVTNTEIEMAHKFGAYQKNAKIGR